MSVRAALARGRAAHAQLYVDTCTIKRQSGSTLDPDTNVLTPTWDTIYSGPCRLKAPTTAQAQALVGDQSVTTRQYDLDLPWDADGPVQVNDVATLDTSDDAWAVGVPLTVLDAGLSGSTTSRRLTVEGRS